MPLEIQDTCIPAPEQPAVTLDLPAGVPPLTSLYVYAAGSCNLACRHCWIVPQFQPDGNGGPYVELAWVEKAIREAKPLGLRSVKLTGGEPTLHPQFRELVTLINAAELNIAIETNGTLVDASLAQFLKATPRICFISVSVDGATAEAHDTLRAVPGSYARACDGIRHLVAAGFHPQMICSLYRGNVSQVAEVVASAERLGCGSVKFNLIQEVGRGEKFSEQLGLELTEMLELNRYVESELVPRSQISIYFDIPKAFHSLRRLMRSGARCAILNILGMLATGELSICGIGTTVPELIYGHIGSDDLREVWCHSDGLARLRAQIPQELEGICGNCLHRDICLGNCVANNFYGTSKLNAPYSLCARAAASELFPASRKRQP